MSLPRGAGNGDFTSDAYVEDIQLVLDFSDFVTAGARCHIQY